MLVRYFFLLLFPIAMMIVVNHEAKAYYGKGFSRNTIIRLLLTGIGIIGIVFVLCFDKWNIKNILIYEFSYGMASIAATYGYMYWIDKQNRTLISEARTDSRQTIDIKKMSGNISVEGVH